MNIYKKSFIFIIILIIFFLILNYVKSVLLYYPIAANSIKYQRFFQKLLHLTETQNYIITKGIITPDGFTLDTVFVKNPDSDKCIIFFHGNAGNISMRYDMVKFLYNYCSVLIFDYRSYGRSTSSTTPISSAGLKIDAHTIWSYATTQLKINPNNLSFVGESLGCAVAIDLASDLSRTHDQTKYPHSLILNSPFYSLTSMIEVIFDKVNISYLGTLLAYVVGREYQSNELIQYLNHYTKILIAHSPRDEIVPYIEGKKLFKLLIKTHPHAKFVNVTGTHNNLGLTDNYIYSVADLFND
jgi:fermentation-respiration switch protein FrsA (DUF1100 family)